MKAQLDSNPHHHHSNVLGVRSTDAKISKAHRQNKEEENEEIKAYLNKLQEIVPFMPKHKKLSKLEVISHVIDYIRDLRETLGMPPTAARLPPIIPCMDMDVEPLSPTTPADLLSSMSVSGDYPALPHAANPAHPNSRTPLSLISTPNSSLPSTSCGAQEIPQLMDKSPSSEVDTRPVSC